MRRLFLMYGLLITFCCKGQDQILSDPLLKHASISISMVDLSSGEEVYTYDPDRSLIPASTLKLFTGIPALDILGEDYRFSTEIAYTGTIEGDGTLSGDLYIIGGGDPCLGSDRIAGNPDTPTLIKLIGAKIASKISCIDGRIIVLGYDAQDRYPVPQGWLFEDLGNYYGAGIWPINLDENRYYLTFDRSGKVGSTSKIIKSVPKIDGLSHLNKVVIAEKGSGDQSYILASPYQYKRHVVGTLPQGKNAYTIKGAMPDPPRFFMSILTWELDRLGISYQGTQLKKKHHVKALKPFTKIKSPPLIDIVKSIHLESNNFYTEAVANLLKSRNSDLNIDLGQGAKLVDACGLSPQNRLSSRQMASFLAKQSRPSSSLLTTLPRVGFSGTLKNMLKSSPARGKIYAKSGSMSGVLCYAGYMEKAGKWYSFSIMMNNFDRKIREMKPLAASIMESLYLK